jgi:hypothetical protein
MLSFQKVSLRAEQTICFAGLKPPLIVCGLLKESFLLKGGAGK